MNRLGFGILLVAVGAYVEGSVRGWPAFVGLAVALAGIFTTLTADPHQDETEPEHAIAGGAKLIIAGSLSQAEVAAEKLGLERFQWRYVHFAQALEGATIDDVVLAMPIVSYSRRYTDIVEEVGRIAERDGRRPETVVT